MESSETFSRSASRSTPNSWASGDLLLERTPTELGAAHLARPGRADRGHPPPAGGGGLTAHDPVDQIGLGEPGLVELRASRGAVTRSVVGGVDRQDAIGIPALTHLGGGRRGLGEDRILGSEVMVDQAVVHAGVLATRAEICRGDRIAMSWTPLR